MWLLPVLAALSSAAVRVFYRLEVQGPQVPREGPLLLFANHPNSLLDPAMVAAAAHRPVRFLAKSPLFSHGGVGWLVRAAGAIPVYRKIDDAGATARNVEMFKAVRVALAEGAAVGVFPEGITHSEPSMTKLKTGAARIALGFSGSRGRSFPLVPIGIVLRDKGVFRSEVVVVRGDPVSWDDLALRGVDDESAARELTARLDESLRQVTLNLERWEDRPLIQFAEAIWSAECGPSDDPGNSTGRTRRAAEVLADLRRRQAPGRLELAREITAHRRRLATVGLHPADLVGRVDLDAGSRWLARRLYLVLPPAVAIAAVGFAIFWPAYRLTGAIVGAIAPPPEQRSTHKVLIGALVYLVWIVLLGGVVGRIWSIREGLAAVAALPVVGLWGLWIRERWSGAWTDLRRTILLHSRRELFAEWRTDQRHLARRLDQVYDDSRERGGVR